MIDAKAINLPMLDRMYKEYPKGEAPEALERLAGKIRDGDGFVFITGEYNWGLIALTALSLLMGATPVSSRKHLRRPHQRLITSTIARVAAIAANT